jgi:hypothetical protein
LSLKQHAKYLAAVARPDDGALAFGIGSAFVRPKRQEKEMGIASVKRVGTQLLLVATPLAVVRPGYAIPAFARKYGLPCSACHEAWPMLNNFGQTFKDNGYQLGNERDAPSYQQPAYWPIMFRVTPQWHRESNNRIAVDNIGLRLNTSLIL